MHPRNLHKKGYELTAMATTYPALKPFIVKTAANQLSIDFSSPVAVKTLNAALLAHYYRINHWDIPKGHLCPPVPGRADYIHHIADLINENRPKKSGNSQPQDGKLIKGLDVGVGANLIYPIIGCQLYDWHFVGSDCSQDSLISARKIIKNNPSLQNNIELRHQDRANHIFHGVVTTKDNFDFTMWNPPFHTDKKLLRLVLSEKIEI